MFCRHYEPPLDEVENYFNVTRVTVDGDWTSVTFVRPYAGDGENEVQVARYLRSCSLEQ